MLVRCDGWQHLTTRRACSPVEAPQWAALSGSFLAGCRRRGTALHRTLELKAAGREHTSCTQARRQNVHPLQGGRRMCSMPSLDAVCQSASHDTSRARPIFGTCPNHGVDEDRRGRRAHQSSRRRCRRRRCVREDNLPRGSFWIGMLHTVAMAMRQADLW